MKDVLAAKLAGLGSREEKYNAAREFLQELILQIMDRQGYFANLAFVGGTALRVLYDLPRFSEDLDFCLVKKDGFRFDRLLAALKRELGLNGFDVEASADKKEKNVLGEFIRFKGLLFDLGLTSHKAEKLFIKLEIDANPPAGYLTEISLVNKNFLFKVRSYDLPSLFAAKLHAFLFRQYAKGRDYYDLLWFLARKTPVNCALLSAAAEQTEGGRFNLDANALKALLREKIAQTDFHKILNDVAPFLSDRAEREYFKKDYFLTAIEKGLA
ncbi:MAG: nucleotidyl transferase AbiEii/AbiGii toxin family protein [Candidatus Saganbacteria bacterium]|nr:nucleotidyl transferase AbiEii/AbiGii toxin family protein [Candidatus Saganbacteria bacterium]